MPLFRRRAGNTGDATRAFWDWWQREGRDAAERSTGSSAGAAAFAELMSQHVATLGSLGWEIGAGETSRHVLVLTSEGDPALRALARRVVLAAPEADDTWSYVDARPPAQDPESVVLSAGDGDALSLGEVVVGARKAGTRLDVVVHHPAFKDLPQEVRAQVTFLALDTALGEVDTEVWLGEVTPAELAPLDGFGLNALRAVVRDLKGQHVDRDGNPGWVLLQGETPAGPLVAAARAPLHPLTAPHLDTHVAVVLPYDHATEAGLPADGSVEALREVEDTLAAELGVSGAVVAHQSVAGVRTLHVYVDSAADAVPVVRRVAATWPQGKASVHAMSDPGWQAVSHLRS
jgi:hypothetical protein